MCDCGNGAESHGLAAADSREAEPRCEMSCELAHDDQRAGNNHERREDTQKSPFACPSQFLDPITTDIRQSDGQRRQNQQKQRFSWRLLPNAVVQMFRCSAFLRLLTRAMEQHADTNRFTMKVAAGSSRING